MFDSLSLSKRIQKRFDIEPDPAGNVWPGMPVPKIVCADGFAMSVQAGKSSYCEPRQNDGPWAAVEVGFPTAREESLMPFCEDPDKPTGTVYGYVPIDIVVGILNAHGGEMS